MTEVFSRIAEEKIREAMRNGEFANLEGAGKPLAFEDETWIPEDLRMAYKILKNAGCTPPELELRKEIISLRELIDTIDDDRERLRKVRELNFKMMKFSMMRQRPLTFGDFPGYELKLYEKMID